jgi:diguanylate cyclase (GGDEF)-like protein
VAISVLNAWRITKDKRYHPNIILFGLVPAILFFVVVSLEKQGIVAILWSYPAVVFFYFILPERKAWIANAILIITIIPLAWISFDHALSFRIVATLILVNIFSGLFVNVITAQQKSLQKKVVTDPLTGLLNRVLLIDTLQQALDQNMRAKIPMTLVAFDLDHFKKINDAMGHDVGDLVLIDIAKLFKDRLRRVDKVFRTGGEEFLALLYNADMEDGRRIAEDIRIQVELLKTLPGHTITVSAGVATLQSNEDLQEWRRRSDQNLYRAKETGRNRVVAC